MEKLGFIVGTGRCGSTITAQLLNAHSQVLVPHELQILVSVGNGDRLDDIFASGAAAAWGPHEFAELFRRCCPYRFETTFDYVAHLHGLDWPQTDPAVLARGLFAAMCRASGKSVFLEQTPWYGQRLDRLARLFPDLEVIHVVRDGRDVALSFARSPWWFDDVGLNLSRWVAEATAIADWGAAHPDRYVEIRYEDLVEAPERELGRGLAFFGLAFEPGQLDPDNLERYEERFRDQTDRPESPRRSRWDPRRDGVLFKGSVGAWRECRDFDFARGTSLYVAGALERFGYAV